MRILIAVIAVAVGLGLVTQAAGSVASDIKAPTAKVDGATLTKWTKRFFFYDGAISVVDGSHPALDDGDVDCSIGQTSRKVWFLETAPSLTSDFERRCAVPKGTVLYVPVFQWFCSEEIDGQPIPECLAFGDEIFSIVELELRVDGVTLDNAALQAYRVQTGIFELPLAEDSFWEFAFGVELDDSITFASDAIGALVGPLSQGEHEIEVSAASEEFGFEGSLTYHLTVAPLKK